MLNGLFNWFRRDTCTTGSAGVTYTIDIGPMVSKERPQGQSCKNCRYVLDYSETEPADEVNAYCGHPNHRTPLSEHFEYGGHWTHTDAWCKWWTEEPPSPPAPARKD